MAASARSGTSRARAKSLHVPQGQQRQGRVRTREGRERFTDGAVAAADHQPLSTFGHGLLRQLGCVALSPRVAQTQPLDRRLV